MGEMLLRCLGVELLSKLPVKIIETLLWGYTYIFVGSWLFWFYLRSEGHCISTYICVCVCVCVYMYVCWGVNLDDGSTTTKDRSLSLFYRSGFCYLILSSNILSSLHTSSLITWRYCGSEKFKQWGEYQSEMKYLRTQRYAKVILEHCCFKI